MRKGIGAKRPGRTRIGAKRLTEWTGFGAKRPGFVQSLIIFVVFCWSIIVFSSFLCKPLYYLTFDLRFWITHLYLSSPGKRQSWVRQVHTPIKMVTVTYVYLLNWVSDCYLMPIQQFFSYTIYQWYDDELRFVLDQHAEFYIASSLKQQSAGRHVAPLDTLFWFRANQSLLFLLMLRA